MLIFILKCCHQMYYVTLPTHTATTTTHVITMTTEEYNMTTQAVTMKTHILLQCYNDNKCGMLQP